MNINNVLNELVFTINDNVKFVIESPVPIVDLALWQYVNIKLYAFGNEYLLYKDDIGCCLSDLRCMLQLVFEKNHILNRTILKKDIGLYHNRVVMRSFKERMERLDNCYSYLVFEVLNTDSYHETWLYNDEVGNIVFHVTKLFNYHDDKPHKELMRLYKEFMKSYKPILVCTIDENIIPQWLETIAWLEESIEDNNPRYIQENNLMVFRIDPKRMEKRLHDVEEKIEELQNK